MDNLHNLPSVDSIMRSSGGMGLATTYGRDFVVCHVRQELDNVRRQLRQGEGHSAPSMEIILTSVHQEIGRQLSPSLRPILNLTGTVLHTNLGRAPLPIEAMREIERVSIGASNLEFDLATGKRGDRDDHIEGWLRRLTGAEAATVVNNNAAAVLLSLNSLALRKEVVVSRGELVEIGGSFRIPDIMSRAGSKLIEVGTTNRTHLPDYANAISEKTGMIMRVHTSNYEVQGFTARVSDEQISELAKEQGVPFVVDLGSGALVDLVQFGLPPETTVRETFAAGADLVTFSGDKLLGGPQAGLIAGRADLIAKIKKNPMKRALRIDKMTMAALGAILPMYSHPEKLVDRIPALSLLTRSREDIETQAQRVCDAVKNHFSERFETEVVECYSQIGSGSQPVARLASSAIRFTPRKKRGGGELKRLTTKLRQCAQPVVCRIESGALWLDLRCLEDDELLISQLMGVEL